MHVECYQAQVWKLELGFDAGWDFDHVVSCDVRAFELRISQNRWRGVPTAPTALNPAPFQSSCSRLISSSDSVFSTFTDGSALFVFADVAIFEEGMDQSPSCSATVSLASMSTGMSGSAFSLLGAKDMAGI